MLLRKIYLTILIIIIVSCSINNKKNIKYKRLNAEISENIKKANELSDILILTKKVNLETNGKCLIGNIESIIYLQNESKIIISDPEVSKKLFVFNNEGKFLYNIGKNGNGPGEFSSPNKISYNLNILSVYDKNNNKILYYNLDGTFINEFNLPPQCTGSASKILLDRKKLYLYSDNLDEKNNGSYNTKVVYEFKNYKNYYNKYVSNEDFFFISEGDLIKYSGRILFTGLFSGNIYGFNQEEEVNKVVELGILYNTEEAMKQRNPTLFIMKKINQIDGILRLADIKGFLFIERFKGYTIVNRNFSIIKKDLDKNLEIPPKYDINGIRLGNAFYNNGFIYAGIDTTKINENFVPNPTLLFYELKE